MIWLALCSQSGIYSVLADVICILEEYTVPMFQLLCVVQVGRIGKSDITLDLGVSDVSPAIRLRVRI